MLILCQLTMAQDLSRGVVVTPSNPTIQPGGSVTLTATGASFYLWTPESGLSTGVGPTVVASPSVTTTYTCTGYEPGEEKVVNADFAQGNTGFTSAYRYTDDLVGEGTYCVGEDASDYHHSFIGHGHGGSGNFMIVNGATVPGTNVWTESITVRPYTYYAFSTWVCTVSVAGNVARLQFAINGEQLGEVFQAPFAVNDWRNFYQIWYSGNTTSANITILNQNTGGGGNDFGLDDISFCELEYDSEAQCTVTVDAMSALDDVATTCEDAPVEVDFLDNDHVISSCNNLTCSIVQQPSHGTASYLDDILTYTPNAGFSGSDAFRYRIDCSGQNAEATVYVTVHPTCHSYDTVSTCDGYYDWHEMHLESEDDYQFVCKSVHGCDSILHLHLSMGSATIIDTYQSACGEYDWEVEGVTYHYEASCDTAVTIPGGGLDCDRIYNLHLTVYPSYHSYDTVSTCDEYYEWYGMPLDIPDDYYVECHTVHGCDSILHLHLTFVTNENTFSEEGSTCAFPYHWQTHGHDFGEIYETGRHTMVVPQTTGCDSIYYLDLSMRPSPVPSEIIPRATELSHYVVPSTEFFVMEYHFSWYDLNGLAWDSVAWSCSNPEWVTAPSADGHECTVIVFGFDNDTVWLSARAFNGCATEGVERRFWLLCSFFGTDENESLDAVVFPNPANELLTIEASEIKKVCFYNSYGQIVECFDGLSGNNLVVDTRRFAPAMYIVEILTNYRKSVKKVVIQR